MNKISCIIFDMDGVIIDTEPLHRKAYYKTFELLGLDVSEELYNSLTGSSTFDAFDKLTSHFNLDKDPKELVHQKRAIYVNLFENDSDLALIEGAEDIITYFYSKGMILILASSSAMVNINRVFKRFNLDQYFTGKISGADLNKSKPHPEIFEKAALLANTHKDRCIVIEDSDNGILAANSAGIYCVGYKSEHSKMQSLKTADTIINSFSELKVHRIINGK